MTKKVSKKTEQKTETVTVKISNVNGLHYISLTGKQVSMSEKDYKYLLEAEKRTIKSQELLKKYFEQN